MIPFIRKARLSVIHLSYTFYLLLQNKISKTWCIVLYILEVIPCFNLSFHFMYTVVQNRVKKSFCNPPPPPQKTSLKFGIKVRPVPDIPASKSYIGCSMELLKLVLRVTKRMWLLILVKLSTICANGGIERLPLAIIFTHL